MMTPEQGWKVVELFSAIFALCFMVYVAIKVWKDNHND